MVVDASGRDSGRGARGARAEADDAEEADAEDVEAEAGEDVEAEAGEYVEDEAGEEPVAVAEPDQTITLPSRPAPPETLSDLTEPAAEETAEAAETEPVVQSEPVPVPSGRVTPSRTSLRWRPSRSR